MSAIFHESHDDDVLHRLISTYRIYIEAVEDYLQLECALWSIDKENYLISVLHDNELLKLTLLNDVSNHHSVSLSSNSLTSH